MAVSILNNVRVLVPGYYLLEGKRMNSYFAIIWRPILIATLFNMFLLIFVPRESIGTYIHAAQPFVRAVSVIYAVYLLISIKKATTFSASLSSFVILLFDFVLVNGAGFVLMGYFSSSSGGLVAIPLFLGSYVAIAAGFMAIGFAAGHFMYKYSHELATGN